MKKFILQLVALMFISMPLCAGAANYENPIQGVFKGIYGDTISIEVPSSVVKSSDANESSSGDLSFLVNSKTGYQNINQLSDLKQGDPVKIEYNQHIMPGTADQKMIATTITKLDEVTTTRSVYKKSSAPATIEKSVTTTTTTTVVNPK